MASANESQAPGRGVDVDRLEKQYPGANAGKPTEVPAKGWWQITRRGLKEFSADQMPLIAAGVAFYAFLSLVPTLIAVILVYGLVTDPQQVKNQIESLSSALPPEAAQLVGKQMTDLATAKQTSLGIGLVISLALALWSASGGVGNLVQAVNTAYDEKETRGFVKKRGLALLLTVGAIFAFIVATSLVAVFPAVANGIGLTGGVRAGFEALRWVVLLLLLMAALAVLYRLAPDRDDPKLRWTSVGAVVAVVVLIVASIGFSIYVNNFGSYGKTYGALAGIVILLYWLWLSVVAVLLGAEINAEAEKQTVQDTTTGPDKPLGERDAVKADVTPDQPDPDPDEQAAGEQTRQDASRR